MSDTNATFSYDDAFARNIGWVTVAEQAALRGKRVAIAGMGGVGGVHLLTLARLGIVVHHPNPFGTAVNCVFHACSKSTRSSGVLVKSD